MGRTHRRLLARRVRTADRSDLLNYSGTAAGDTIALAAGATGVDVSATVRR